jgi:hypothetical protein
MRPDAPRPRPARRDAASRSLSATLSGMWPVVITVVVMIPLLVLAFIQLRRR